MKRYMDLISDVIDSVEEVFPWDLAEWLEQGETPLLLDIREPYEFDAMRLPNSINVPRGILESACEWDYEETVPELVLARDKKVVVICRSGYRSVLGAKVMQDMGYQHVYSLKTGVRGWTEFEQPLIDQDGNTVDEDSADDYFAVKIRPEQMAPHD